MFTLIFVAYLIISAIELISIEGGKNIVEYFTMGIGALCGFVANGYEGVGEMTPGAGGYMGCKL